MRNLLPFIALLLFSFTLLNGNQTDDHIKKFCKEKHRYKPMMNAYCIKDQHEAYNKLVINYYFY